MNKVVPLFHLPHLFGIEIQALGIILDGRRQLRKLLAQLGLLFEQCSGFVIQVCHLLERPAGVVDQILCTWLYTVDERLGFGSQFGQPRGMGRTLERLLKRLLLFHLQLRGFNLVDLKTQQVEFTLVGIFVNDQLRFLRLQ